MESTLLRVSEQPQYHKRDEPKIPTGGSGHVSGGSSSGAPHPPKGPTPKEAVKLTTVNGQKVCQFWQRPKGGCRAGDKCKEAHVCNRVLVSNNKPCGQKHPGYRHKVKDHGEVKMN